MLYDRRWESKQKLAPERQLLLDAASYIEKHGWVRGQLCDDFGRVCAEGALYKVDGTPFPSLTHTWAAAYQLLSKYLNTRPAFWNDAICRDKQEAVETLRRAAYHAL